MKSLVCFFLTCIIVAPHAYAQTFTLANTIFEQAGKDHDVDPLLIYSIALNVSSRYIGDGLIQPSAYAIRSTKLTHHFDNQNSAKQALSQLLQDTDWVDVGLMQISLHYHPQKNPLNLLDPYQNLSAGAAVLKKRMDSTNDPILGVGLYFTSNKDEAIKHGQDTWGTYSRLRMLINEQELKQ